MKIERIGSYRYYPETEGWIEEILNTNIEEVMNSKEMVFYKSKVRGIQESDYERIQKQCNIRIKDLPDARPEMSAIMYNEDGIINALIISGIKSLKDEYGPNPDEYGGEKFYWADSREILAVYINPDYIIDFQEIDQLITRVNGTRNQHVLKLWCKTDIINEDIAEILGAYILPDKVNYYSINLSICFSEWLYDDTSINKNNIYEHDITISIKDYSQIKKIIINK